MSMSARRESLHFVAASPLALAQESNPAGAAWDVPIYVSAGAAKAQKTMQMLSMVADNRVESS